MLPEYTTLKSTGSSVSQESHDSGASVNGAFIGAFRTSTGRSITTTDTESKPPASPSSHGSQRSSNNNNNRVPGSGHMSRLSMRSNHSTTSDMSSAPLAKPEFVEINSEFYYEAPTADTPSSYGQTDVTATTPTKNEKTTATIFKQKRIEKLLPKFGRLILDSSPSAGPSTVIFSSNDSSDTPTTGVVEMNVDDHGNVTVDPTDPSTSPQKTSSSKTAAVSRLTYQFRCHSSESIFLEVESPTEPIPPESPPTPTKGFLRNRRVIRRQGSLREGGNSRRNRSQIRVPRSFLSANIAHKFVASFRQKTSRIQQTSTDDGVEIVSVSRLDSFGNPTKRTGPTNSTSMPQSPNMSKKSSL
uniref:Uncharacterized protein n=1 Tax=Panagrolaimus sp. PS1159 TaxID=55785 RepID=A0AC35EVA7_9BILA